MRRARSALRLTGCAAALALAPVAEAAAQWPTATPPTRLDVRPFITDDARVVGGGLAQAESWFRWDHESTQQWLLAAVGPTPWLELTVGGVAGADRRGGGRRFTYALPLVQGKFLLRPYAPGRGPGVALVAGSFLPGGSGLLRPEGYGAFTFAIASQSLGERDAVLLHANLGVNHLWLAPTDRTILTWGVGTQLRAVGGLHVVAELFSGDPYVAGSGKAWQAGLRHFVSDAVQVDATVGHGVGGAAPLPTWWTLGLRLVTPRLWGAPPP
ncbi:MAG: hypothetical protein NW201_00650 [Gemmatimonadales bacterium]|nr:hypothetical protein [Gemmatimonadales bacterium]